MDYDAFFADSDSMWADYVCTFLDVKTCWPLCYSMSAQEPFLLHFSQLFHAEHQSSCLQRHCSSFVEHIFMLQVYFLPLIIYWALSAAKTGVTYNSVLCLNASCEHWSCCSCVDTVLLYSGSLGSWMTWDLFGPWNPPVCWLEFTSWTSSFPTPCWHRGVKTTACSGSTLNSALQCWHCVI